MNALVLKSYTLMALAFMQTVMGEKGFKGKSIAVLLKPR